jgi:hypothetical protein
MFRRLPPYILDKGKPVVRPGRKAKGQLLAQLAARLPKGCASGGLLR